MRVSVLAVGCRGDVAPLVALAHALARRGLETTVVTHPWAAPLVEECGVGFAPVALDWPLTPDALPDVADRLPRHPLQFGARLRALYRAILEVSYGSLLDECVAVCERSDAVVYSLHAAPVHHAGEAVGIPTFPALLAPLTPTRAFPHPLYMRHARTLPPYLNRRSYAVGNRIVWEPFRRRIDRWRTSELGLRPLRRPGTPAALDPAGRATLYSFSRHVVPVPADWPASAHVPGYWYPSAAGAWTPPAELVDFLDVHPEPLLVTLGTIKPAGFATKAAAVLDAVVRTGRPAIAIDTWGTWRAGALPDAVHVTDFVPFDWLLPRVGAVLHHAGAGTTAEVLRKGVPAAMVPLFPEQEAWAIRVARLGAGVLALRGWRRPDRLAAKLDRLRADPTFGRRAARLAARIAREPGADGAARAVADEMGC
jgi:sterol 3beta-glucosyltransferase